jgi:hypothetical protein
MRPVLPCSWPAARIPWSRPGCPRSHHRPAFGNRLQRLRRGWSPHHDCPAKEDNEHSFCIRNGRCSAAGYDADQEEPLYTAGTSAARVDRILPVSELMAELAGMRDALPSAA